MYAVISSRHAANTEKIRIATISFQYATKHISVLKIITNMETTRKATNSFNCVTKHIYTKNNYVERMNV